MRTALALLILLALLGGCKTPKKTVQSAKVDYSNKTEAHVIENSNKTEEKELKTTLTVEAESNSNLLVYQVNYDTDKPVDPGTGKPPVKSELYAKKAAKTAEKTVEQVNEASSTGESTTVADNSRYNISESAKTAHKETPKTGAKYIVGTLLTLAVLVICWLFGKKGGWLRRITKL